MEFKVSAHMPNGQEIARDFANLQTAQRTFKELTQRHKYASVTLVEWTEGGPEEIDSWMGEV